MLLRMLDINVLIKQVDLGTRQQHGEEFLKINPAHQIHRDRVESHSGLHRQLEGTWKLAVSGQLEAASACRREAVL
jgi:hypothetical protein